GAFRRTTLEVNPTADGAGAGPGQLSLRQAVNLANALATPGTIGFDPAVFAGPQTITLTAGPLVLTDPASTTITGPGASLLTVSGNMAGMVFDIVKVPAARCGRPMPRRATHN